MTARRENSAAMVLVGLLALGFGIAAVYFATLQNIWIDETTQLSGLTLPPGRLFAWLSGTPEPGFGVPPDRAPPFGYLIDAACGRTLCATPFAFRLLHLALTLAGVGVLLAAMRRHQGAWPAAVSAAVLFLSPKLVVTAVEIRAYPLFFAIACVQIALLADLVAAPRLRPGRLSLFAVTCVLACYTHFFGIIATAALFAGLFAARVRTGREAAMIGGAGVAVALCWAGVLPFVTGATAISGQRMRAASLQALASFPFKLMTDIYVVLVAPLAGLMLLTFAGLLLLAGVRALRSVAAGPARRWSPEAALLAALLLGLGVTVLASFVPLGFDPLVTGYSIWTFPVLAWLAGSACASTASPGGRGLVRTGRGMAMAFGIAAALASATFLDRAAWFVHGPDAAIATAVGPQPAGTAVIQRGAWAFAYYPTIYRFHRRVPQWLISPDGSLHRLIAGRPDPAPAGMDVLAPYRRVVLVDTRLRGALELRRLWRGTPPAAIVPPDPVPAAAGALHGFVAAPPIDKPGLYWATVTVFQRPRGSHKAG